MTQVTVSKIIIDTLCNIWTKELMMDYKSGFVYDLASLKTTLYYHIRNHLGDIFLKQHNLVIYIDFKLASNQYFDLAIVQTHQTETQELLVAMKLKWIRHKDDKITLSDIHMLPLFLELEQYKNVQFVTALVKEPSMISDDAISLLPQTMKQKYSNFSELIAYHKNNLMKWEVKK
ncbi:hypothetical protein [Lysinibacillus sp. LZ02]|uniref:hypothetical protein n=1 Tax=Lysinibacillus sp. LZ02 TaxID=3420668 RepID=UPI003D35B464